MGRRLFAHILCIAGCLATASAIGQAGSFQSAVQKSTVTVPNNVGAYEHSASPASELIPARTDDEINAVFDRAKGAFNAIYTRAWNQNNSLPSAGVIVLSFVIQPDGSVKDCKLVKNTFADPELADRFVQRVSLMNFGPKAVPAFTVPHYPIRISAS